ncbi:hypothetical protein FIE12Z_617 [Fusarium flagelliforme]|uniref:Uncharacterized protein n=1 Tax=Fusarium flagelliforme TaxID=2675880 RepID=A0A395N501_9HYPO|nr:hypothetical protein FIE12Z_617 [Fusarium flagelliforme]
MHAEKKHHFRWAIRYDSLLIWAAYLPAYLTGDSTPPLHLAQLPFHNNKMHEDWKPVLGEIASWIADEPTDNNLRFGHIEGPCAANKIVKVPLLLQHKLKRMKRPGGILLVVPEFRKDHVKAALDGQRYNHLTPMQILTYAEATDMLKHAYSSTSVAIIQADCDYSAEFALALMSLTTVVAKASRNMRLLTLSSEATHSITKTLFSSYGGRLFKLANHHRGPFPIFYLKPGQEIFDVIKITPDTTLNFSRVTLHDAWRRPLVQSNVNELGTEVGIDLDFLAQIGIRTPTLIQARGHFCLVLCNTRERQIFDIRSRQICEFKLLCSKSEMVEQLSWCHRVQAAPGCSSYVLTPAEQLYESAVRRMSACNEQAGGFMAALIEFAEWPLVFRSLLHILDKNQMDSSYVFKDMQRRLYRQGLAIPDESAFGWSISPDVHEKVFFKILRIVNYDHRIAHFLCQKSEDNSVTAGKMLIAAILASDYGFEPRLVHEVDEGFTAKLNAFLLHSYFGVWVVTGYIPFKVAIMEAIVHPSARINISNRSPAVLQDLGIQVQEHGIVEVQSKCRLLIQALKDSQVPINGTTNFSSVQLPITPARLQEIKLHLARAYLHQIAEISTDEEGLSHAKDKLSDQPFHISEESADVLSFKKDSQGVYTSLRCSGDGGPRCMSDFTYIDEDILQKLDHELRDRKHRGIDDIRTTFALGSNSYKVY